MEFVKEAAHVNLQGAAYCASGDTQNGFESFRSALRILSEGASNLPETRSTQSATDASSGILQRLSINPNDSRPPTASGNCRYHIHQEPMLFNPPAEVNNGTIALLLSVIEFNMALTFHLQSLREGRNKSLNVTKALKLYSFCLQHVKHSMGYSEASNILVATLNNQAQLLREEKCEHEEADLTVDALKDAVAYCSQNPGVFSCKEVEEFQLNVFIFMEIKFAAAA